MGDSGGVPYREAVGEYCEVVGEYHSATKCGEEEEDSVDRGYGVGGHTIGDRDLLDVVGMNCTHRCQ